MTENPGDATPSRTDSVSSRADDPPANVPDPDDPPGGSRERAETRSEREAETTERAAEYAAALRGAGYERPVVLLPEHVTKLNERRTAVIDYLRDNRPDSMREVARDLDYSPSLIADDLEVLAEIGVVTVERTGRGQSSRPRLLSETVLVSV
jgi:DNA-binding transcriptional ArsR family regulator